MKFIRLLLVLGLATLGACTSSYTSKDESGSRAEAQASQGILESAPAPIVSRQNLRDHVNWLADDEREGRMTGTKSLEESARWLAEHFSSFGLEPMGDNGTFFQAFEATVGIAANVGNALDIDGWQKDNALGVDEDFAPFGFSENGTVEGEIVFAGYGITDESSGYDDYEGLDVEGKIVLVLRHEPQQKDPDSVFNGTSWSHHAIFRNKARNARDHGAAGIMIFTGPLSDEYEEDVLVPLSGEQGVGKSGIVAVHISKEVGERLFDEVDQDVKQWMHDVDKDLKPRSFTFSSKYQAKIEVELKKDTRETENVVALLPGTDPDGEVVVLGAHYDHLGRGDFGSLSPSRRGEIHNGADDNASGTAALVELARVFSLNPPKRNLVFVAFSGEELGLLGSEHFVSEPPVELDQIQAMLNMDMIGRPQNNTLTIGGTGTSPAFDGMIDDARDLTYLKISTSESGFGASDHTSFYAKDIPVLFFFSGLHGDYHRPSDDPHTIDHDGHLAATTLVYAMAEDLANREHRVEFAKAEVDQDNNPHTASSSSSGSSGGGGYGPYLGTIPEFGDREEPGVALSGVRSGSPAEKGGIQGGDVVIRFAGRDIGDLYDYTYALRDHKPGDTVEIVVLRDGKEVPLTVTLGHRE